MAISTDLPDKSLAIDSRSLGNLKMSVKDNSPESIKAAAKQFEALFMNMMLKSMRQAGGQNGPFDNEQTRTFTSMLDQQLTQNLSGKGIGLADALVKQLTNNAVSQALKTSDDDGVSSATSAASARGINSYLNTMKIDQKSVSSEKTDSSSTNHVQAFQDKLAAHAEEASKATGIPAKFMLGQAALETGWGKKQIKTVDGSESHNVFGMKATSSWKGKTVNAVTTEYVNGVAQRKVEKFKAYDSYADAFKDYANLLTSNPRYGNVIANSKDATSFAYGMQKAGYATDPQYANKLSKIIKQNLSA